MQDLTKKRPCRNTKYLKWVATLDCCLSGVSGCSEAHHVIGVGEGGAGTKASDLFAFPVTREWHTKIHNHPELWPDQWQFVSKTLQEAVKQGVLIFSGEYPK